MTHEPSAYNEGFCPKATLLPPVRWCSQTNSPSPGYLCGLLCRSSCPLQTRSECMGLCGPADPCLPLWLPPQGQPGFLVAPSQWHRGDVLGLEKSPLHALLLKRETEGGGPGFRNKGVAMVTSEESNSSPLRADGRVRQLAPQPGQGQLAGCHGDCLADQVLQFFWGPGQDQFRVPQTHRHPHPHLNLQDQPLCKGQASEGHSSPLAF